MKCGPDCYWIIIKKSLAIGPHCSMIDPEYSETVKEYIIYQVEVGLSHIIPW